jgi:hypothetical protein
MKIYIGIQEYISTYVMVSHMAPYIMQNILEWVKKTKMSMKVRTTTVTNHRFI